MTDQSHTSQIRQARGKFVAMAATYSLGVFNDSFFRQSAMLLAVSGGAKHMQGWIMVMFTAPYLMFASQAGWLADRFPKRNVVIGAKLLELLAMLCGAVGICMGNWNFILTMVFVMGLQSCLFSPALNGSIPELYPSSYVTQANAMLKVVVTVAILGGISISGLALSRKGLGWADIPLGRLIVAISAVSVSIAGAIGSLGVPRRPAANPRSSFPWSGPFQTLKQLTVISKDTLLAKVVATNTFLWFTGSAIVQLINVLAMEQFGCAENMAGYMVAAEIVGVAVGGIVGSRLAKGLPLSRFLPGSVCGMGAVLVSIAALPGVSEPFRLPVAFVLLMAIGVFGGIVMIPCEAFVQIRAPRNRRGVTIAATNFAVFSGIIVSGPVANVLAAKMAPTSAMGVIGGLSVLVGLCLHQAMKSNQEIQA